MDKDHLTRRQKEVYEYIKRMIRENGYPPSVREIGEAIGLNSTSTVHAHLESLEEKGFVCSVVLCEIVWVLHRCYAVKRHAVADILSKLLSLDTIEVEHGECAVRALPDFAKGTADFSDYYLARVNKEKHHATTTVTFDKNAAKSDLFRLLK